MSPSDDENPTEAEPAELLAAFIKGGRSEEDFRTLVGKLGNLVYSSALRRTDNPELAEEVSQNVFTILARKAKSLEGHPALLAWLFKTTRLEASKALRGERRRQRKHDALAEMTPPDSDMPSDDEAWRDAVPHLDASLDKLPERDRQVVLQRFYQGKRFKEIAASDGTSEAASKMRVKRALEKLSRLLSARGVSLSTAAIATALGSELARSAPAATLSALAPKALAAASTAGAATATTSTVQIMSTIKTTATTSAAVVAIAAAPFIWQESQASKLREELSGLEARKAALQLGDGSDREARAPARTDRGAAARTVREILAAGDSGLTLEDLLNSMMDVMMSQDIVGMLKVFLPIAQLSPEEYEQLIGELEAYKGNPQVKQMALQVLGMFVPSEDPRESLERMLRLDAEPYSYSNLLKQWASQDPDAAMAWYDAKLDSGELHGKGLNNSPHEVLYGDLLGGIAKAQPDRALEIYAQLRKGDGLEAGGVLWDLAQGLGDHVKDSGDHSALQRLIALDPEDLGHSKSVVRAALNTAVDGEDFAGAVAFVDRYIEDPRERRRLLVGHLSDGFGRPLDAQVEQLVTHLPQDQAPLAVGELIQRRAWRSRAEEIDEWLERQAPGAIRDHGLNASALRHGAESRFEEAAAAIEQIGDLELRENAAEELQSLIDAERSKIEGGEDHLDHFGVGTGIEQTIVIEQVPTE